jgi:hypothetical protein
MTDPVAIEIANLATGWSSKGLIPALATKFPDLRPAELTKRSEMSLPSKPAAAELAECQRNSRSSRFNLWHKVVYLSQGLERKLKPTDGFGGAEANQRGTSILQLERPMTMRDARLWAAYDIAPVTADVTRFIVRAVRASNLHSAFSRRLTEAKSMVEGMLAEPWFCVAIRKCVC